MLIIDVYLVINKLISGINVFLAIKAGICKRLLLSSSWKDLNCSINTLELKEFVSCKLELHLLTRNHQGDVIFNNIRI